MKSHTTQQILERLAALLRSENRNSLIEHGLQPIQFEALHYFSICNRYSDTLMAVTEYLGQTKGTVSQTLKVLERKDLIKKEVDSEDKRVTRLSVTKTGKALISQMIPAPLLESAVKSLPDREISKIDSGLTALLSALQKANQSKTFGLCETCRHNQKSASNKYWCGLTQESLTIAETHLICREHAPVS